MSRDLDLVVYGATGYTGQLIAEYLQAPQPLSTADSMGARRAQREAARTTARLIEWWRGRFEANRIRNDTPAGL